MPTLRDSDQKGRGRASGPGTAQVLVPELPEIASCTVCRYPTSLTASCNVGVSAQRAHMARSPRRRQAHGRDFPRHPLLRSLPRTASADHHGVHDIHLIGTDAPPANTDTGGYPEMNAEVRLTWETLTQCVHQTPCRYVGREHKRHIIKIMEQFEAVMNRQPIYCQIRN